MKSISKIIFALMILVSSATAQSFTQPGTVELGGDISFSSQTLTEPYNSPYYYPNNSLTATQTSFSFNPYFGVMVVRGFELGLQPGIAVTNPGAVTTLNLLFAPAYNFYTQSNFYPYAEFLVGYNSIKEGSYTSSGLGVGGDVGFKLAIKGSSMFLFKLEYLNQSFSNNEPAYYNNFGNYYPQSAETKYSIGTLSVGVGFRIFISRSEKSAAPAEKGK